MTGWFTILTTGFGAAAQLKAAGSIMDDTFFSGHMANTMKDFMNLGEKRFLLDSAPDFLALFLSLIFSGIVSANTSETKLLNSALYFINQCCLICLTILFIGYIDFNNWIPFKLNHLIVLTNSFLSTSVIYSTILTLVFLGEEAINPSKTLPKAHVLSFIFGLILFSVFSLLITLVWNYREIESSNSIQSILIYLKLNGLTFIPLIGVTCFVYNSLFIDMFSLTRVVCAMSRDGLLYRVLSRVEHFNNMPVKPSFICGIVAGVVAMFGRQTTLREIEAISFLMISAMAPVCTLRMRYAHNIEHFKGKVSSPHGKPSPTCDVIVLVLKVSVMGMAVTTRHILNDFINIHWISWKILPLFLFTVSMLISMVFLILQPMNVTHSPYRVRLIPFVPMLDIFIHYFAIGNIEAKFLYFIILWALFGLIFYFTYSIWHSKEEI
ncbi:probable cationic amino acid transporter isoform X2 [Cimex lectularius]|nr:probable cationic amino acid transporter isoform X2 [Cimex lectularius]